MIVRIKPRFWWNWTYIHRFRFSCLRQDRLSHELRSGLVQYWPGWTCGEYYYPHLHNICIQFPCLKRFRNYFARGDSMPRCRSRVPAYVNLLFTIHGLIEWDKRRFRYSHLVHIPKWNLVEECHSNNGVTSPAWDIRVLNISRRVCYTVDVFVPWSNLSQDASPPVMASVTWRGFSSSEVFSRWYMKGRTIILETIRYQFIPRSMVRVDYESAWLPESRTGFRERSNTGRPQKR